MDYAEPPSYNHAIQSTLDPSMVKQYGTVSDASEDSFQRGELFIQAFRSKIDEYPTELVEAIKTQGPFCIMLDTQVHNNTMFRHPLWTDDRPGFRSDGTTFIQFWPDGKPYQQTQQQQLLDTDLTIQGSHPFISFFNNNNNNNNNNTQEQQQQQPVEETIHYFEIMIDQVISPPESTVFSIGLTTKPYPLFRMPGWNQYSIGYHSDDGSKFCDDPTGGQEFGPTWGNQGDVIGCQYHVESGTVHFTLNGLLIHQPAFVGLESHVYYPAIACDGQATVRVNFGATPFKYHCPNWIGYHHHHKSSTAPPIYQ
ncbi:unnamed protein product [Cunninghamella echinulata]